MINPNAAAGDESACASDGGSTPPVPWQVPSEGFRIMQLGSAVLERPTLVLNRNWQPVRVAPVARCLVLLWNEAAHVVDPDDFQLYSWHAWASLTPRDDEPAIRTVRFRLRVPEVVTLTRHDKPRQAAVAFSRRNVFKRDHATCQYCGTRPGTEALTIDHILPRSQGGPTTWENCILACARCNARKANRTPEQAGMRLRKTPTRPAWKPLYDASSVRVASWSRFLGDSAGALTLDESA